MDASHIARNKMLESSPGPPTVYGQDLVVGHTRFASNELTWRFLYRLPAAAGVAADTQHSLPSSQPPEK